MTAQIQMIRIATVVRVAPRQKPCIQLGIMLSSYLREQRDDEEDENAGDESGYEFFKVGHCFSPVGCRYLGSEAISSIACWNCKAASTVLFCHSRLVAAFR